MFYEDNHIKIYNKDCRFMSELPDERVQMVCTSPPYWGLRKYSGEQELIWGDNHCEHQWGKLPSSFKKSNQGVGSNTMSISPKLEELNAQRDSGSSFCSLCGAWKGAYGLEPTPEMYIEHTIEILREIRRVLRKDGVVFWNIGDSYSGVGRGVSHNDGRLTGLQSKQIGNLPIKGYKGDNIIKPKDLCLIPFRVAIATQEDGWWVRSVIIWSKPNPMPESVTDRPTESHEYILMLTKSARYYWDADAVREGYTEPMNRWGGDKFYDTTDENKPDNINRLSRADRLNRPNENGRNIRSVWEFPTQPYPEAHFAVFPEKLPEICIKAATPEVGCCSKCGAPWERITDTSVIGRDWNRDKKDRLTTGNSSKGRLDNTERLNRSRETLGWQPTCQCNADKVPSVVLDPFLGAGTTLWVAKKLNRRAVGYEISKEYCDLALDRNRQQVLC